ncbi:hypothetical protein H2204_002217 [Knufia peltigerae]|uniref:FAD/NAD(P)-binding domain-containing protein n=1 Tax=Knufia peltigerae TaxID=1002370 RepID=A0AA38YCB9_9EURO|nr:hypothetical protein H2204_002217 [Knufia peltigerae]
MSTLQRTTLLRDHLTRPDHQHLPEWRLSRPIHEERHLRVVCVGAGASGLCFAYKLQRSFENFDLQIYEKNPATSGTWHENTYPGCACDVPAHNYTFSWEPKLDWSAVYAGSAEIKKYFQDFAAKYDLDKFVKLNHQVVGAYWDDKVGKWNVQVEDKVAKSTFWTTCDILINASGILNAWRWPAIPGIDRYKGKLLHSANWDHSVQMKGKHVGLIGNGSSGIQILPSIQPLVGHLTTFIREPTWVSPVQGLEQHVYNSKELQEFADVPGALLSLRKQNEMALDTITNIFAKDGQAQKETRAVMTQQMKEKLQNDKLAAQLIPNWGVGCRRLTPGVNYLETLSAPNVTVVYGEINEITEKGCICDDGNEYPVDILICATGFDTSFKPRFPVMGLNKIDLREQWSSEPKGYLGLAASNMPNYFQFLGPNCPVGNGPLLSAIEYQADYMLKFCDRWQTENIHSFSPKQAAIDDFTDFSDEWMKGTVWTEDCRSWYRGGSQSGRITALWPGSVLHYIECVSHIRHDDWDIKYAGNRFNYLGNGRSQVELDFSADWAWYVREGDDSPFLSKARARKVLTLSGKNDAHGQAMKSLGGNLIGKTV